VPVRKFSQLRRMKSQVATDVTIYQTSNMHSPESFTAPAEVERVLTRRKSQHYSLFSDVDVLGQNNMSS
jgi:hypothetical protein